MIGVSSLGRRGRITDKWLTAHVDFYDLACQGSFCRKDRLSGHPEESEEVARSKGSPRNQSCGFPKDQKARLESGNGGFFKTRAESKLV